jgi:hypothetical protein
VIEVIWFIVQTRDGGRLFGEVLIASVQLRLATFLLVFANIRVCLADLQLENWGGDASSEFIEPDQ